jgi:predicted nucleic acid-binding protein
MILVDTSVWIDHFRKNDPLLIERLIAEEVWIHPFVIAEIALGNLANHKSKLRDLQDLARVTAANDAEMLQFIGHHRLSGKGIGFVDTHLLASLHLTPGIKLWTRDKRLAAVAASMGLAFNPDTLLNQSHFAQRSTSGSSSRNRPISSVSVSGCTAFVG